MNPLIAGSRDFNDYDLLKQTVDKLLADVDETVYILSGTARGADRLGERYAEEHGIKVYRFPANWDRHGKAAGHIRNSKIPRRT